MEETQIISQDRKDRLRDHREQLVYIQPTNEELSRLKITLNAYLRLCGFYRVPETLKRKFIEVIFETQSWKPFFWIKSSLPMCWNAPKHFDKDHIFYEWGHLIPRGAISKRVHTLKNLCLMSSRCNNGLQTGLPMTELRRPFAGSLVGNRIELVLQKRAALFKSQEWKEMEKEFEQYRRVINPA
jgi:hypothetical protein